MLKVIRISNRSQVDAIFNSFDPLSTTWLVSDLRTKFELQENILNKYGSYIDETVYRASDLWKLLLRRAQPDLKIVSDPFIRSLIRSLLDQNTELLQGLNSSSEETIYAYIEQMAAIVFHPQGTEDLNQWFEQHPQSEQKWKKWYLAARWMVLQLMGQHKVLSQRWIGPVLLANIQVENFWDRPLVIDLGAELSKTEAELIRALSRVVDVVVLSPYPKWREDFKYLLQPYDFLEAEAQEVIKVDLDQAVPVASAKSQTALRFSGMLAEVKFAVGQVRKWLDQGISTANILVTAPDIESYWPVLKSFLDVEGIAVNKSLAGKLQSLPNLTKWLSQIRIRSGRLSATDLEISFYESERASQLRFEKFKALFNTLYVEEDLNRHQLLVDAFSGKFDQQKIVSRDEFVAQSLVYWSGSDSEHLQVVLREFLANAVSNIRLEWNEWLKYLESIVAVKEWTIQKADLLGITVTKLASAGSNQFSHRIFLGLVEDQLKAKSKLQLDGKEYFELAKDLGFVLNNPDFSDLDFELKWISENPSKVDYYCVGLSDFTGKLQAPSMFWLEVANHLGESHERLSVPDSVRWDEIQTQAVARPGRMSQDLGLEEQDRILVSKALSLSPSGIKDYHQCPFVFAASRVFRLEDHPDIDLDVDPRTKGNLAHYLFEQLGKEPIRFDWSDAEILEVLECGRKEKELVFAAEELWIPMRQKYLNLAKRFLAFENELRLRFPNLKTLSAEKTVQIWYSKESRSFSFEASESSVLISGRIDRVDGDGKQMVVIDYKSSGASAPSTAKWIEECELQMPFYMWALEKRQEPPFTGEVDAALYYIYRDFSLKGFVVNEKAGRLYQGIKTTSRNKVQNDQSGKEQLFKSFEEQVVDKILKVSDGIFAPKPSDVSECSKCKWRRLCRAPHLN